MIDSSGAVWDKIQLVRDGSDEPVEAFHGRFPTSLVVMCGLFALCATLLTIGAIWLQVKHYIKPGLQRYVVRILSLVPIFAAASSLSLVSVRMGEVIEPIRDIYEAFTIYTFFQLLVNYFGGENELRRRVYGRQPVPHFWPCDRVFYKVDIGDPLTFLAIKRGILQYVWVKPVLALASVIMRLAGVWKEGYLGLGSGYMWTGLVYNVSITVCLYSLSMFWVCLASDLEPFRPVPKFLCVKGIVFASYWQGMILSVLVLVGAFPPRVFGYSPDTLAAAIQNALLCFEMPFFAVLHWYAFNWVDYSKPVRPPGVAAANFPTRYINLARMPLTWAIRDAYGCVDLVQDTIMTWKGDSYGYRATDIADIGMPHPDSVAFDRTLSAGKRFERDTGRLYWIENRKAASSTEPLLAKRQPEYGVIEDSSFEPDEDPIEEGLYLQVSGLVHGDYNYPVLQVSLDNKSRERLQRLEHDPEITGPAEVLVTPLMVGKGRRLQKTRKTGPKERARLLDRAMANKPSSSSLRRAAAAKPGESPVRAGDPAGRASPRPGGDVRAKNKARAELPDAAADEPAAGGNDGDAGDGPGPVGFSVGRDDNPWGSNDSV